MEKLWNIQEVEGQTQIKVATLRKYVMQDKIPYIKIGKLVRFRPSEVVAWLDGKKRGGVEAGARRVPACEAGLFDGVGRVGEAGKRYQMWRVWSMQHKWRERAAGTLPEPPQENR